MRVRVLDQLTELRVAFLADGRLERDRGCGRSGATSSTRSAVIAIRGSLDSSSAISSVVGSRPSVSVSSRVVRVTRCIVSTMWTGMRIVRDWSARPRWIAWRIHHVAYVENLKPRCHSNLSTAAHQAGVALLDEIQEAEAAVHVLLGVGDDEPEVRRRQVVAGRAGPSS